MYKIYDVVGDARVQRDNFVGDTITGGLVLGLKFSAMEDRDNRCDNEPDIRSRSPDLRHGLDLKQDDALDLALELTLGLNLELDSERQAGTAYLGKEGENWPYTRKLAERETKDETLRNEVNERSEKSTLL